MSELWPTRPLALRCAACGGHEHTHGYRCVKCFPPRPFMKRALKSVIFDRQFGPFRAQRVGGVWCFMAFGHVVLMGVGHHWRLRWKRVNPV